MNKHKLYKTEKEINEYLNMGLQLALRIGDNTYLGKEIISIASRTALIDLALLKMSKHL